MQYGLVYMGSKSGIVTELCRVFPKADNFYDLFGGGFAVSHFMLLHRGRDYKTFTYNEIQPGFSDLIKDAINGKYSYNNFKPKFITREEFKKLKDSDAYVKLCWSFGCNGRDYLFNPETERLKHALHNAVVFNEFDELAKELLGIETFTEPDIKKRRISTKQLLKNRCELQQLQQLERLEQLQQLERLERLQQLEQLQRLDLKTGSYIDVKIKSNSVVYCDPPYQNTGGYKTQNGLCDFNHKELFEWACDQKEPVFMSEYNIDHAGLKKVWSKEKRVTLCASDKRKKKIENLYANEAGLKSIKYGHDLFL